MLALWALQFCSRKIALKEELSKEGSSFLMFLTMFSAGSVRIVHVV
jgi:hypothetical protein